MRRGEVLYTPMYEKRKAGIWGIKVTVKQIRRRSAGALQPNSAIGMQKYN